MRRSLLLLVALLATACSGPTPPDHWTIERQAPAANGSTPERTICDEIEGLALGSLAAETDMGAALDELARLGAFVGATAALPHLAEAREADDPAFSLAAAAADLDSAGHAECEVPIFSALYVTTSWADCYGEVDIPAANAAAAVDQSTQACHADDSPGFLPCWDVDTGFQPVDCRTGATVRAEAGAWVKVGPS